MTTTTLIETHPLASMFPPMSKADFDDLAADIKANGLRHPIARIYKSFTTDCLGR